MSFHFNPKCNIWNVEEINSRLLLHCVRDINMSEHVTLMKCLCAPCPAVRIAFTSIAVILWEQDQEQKDMRFQLLKRRNYILHSVSQQSKPTGFFCDVCWKWDKYEKKILTANVLQLSEENQLYYCIGSFFLNGNSINSIRFWERTTFE